MLNVAVTPFGSEAMVQVMVPVLPTDGVVQLNAGPVVWFSETNVVSAGSVSVRVTVEASEGPLFVTVTT